MIFKKLIFFYFFKDNFGEALRPSLLSVAVWGGKFYLGYTSQ